MKIKLLAGVLALVLFAMLVAGSKPEEKKDTKGKGESGVDTYCYHKCVKYDSIKGQCSDVKWEGTKKKCVQYKNVGSGKCKKYKTENICKKWSGPSTICIAHGVNQKCSKYETIEVCDKHEFKKVCAHEGSNHHCSEWAYRDVCTDYNKADTYVKCDAYTYIPKLKCTHKQSCKHYKVDRKCSKYAKKCKVSCDWQVVPDTYKPSGDKKTDLYKPPTIYRKVCKKVCNNVCKEYEKKLTCDSYAKVQFCKVASYHKVCKQAAPKKKKADGYLPAPDSYAPAKDFCKKKQRVKYCVKWNAKKHCDNFKKIRVCLKKKKIKYCSAYKTVNFCSQHKTIKKHCVKHATKKTCVEKDKGQQVCVKYEFYGGKEVCEKYASKTKCAEKKKICVPITHEEKKKETKPSTKPSKKPIKKNKKKKSKKHANKKH